MRIEITAVHGHLSLQDRPRVGWRKFGVPPSGPFDPESQALANALLDQDSGLSVLEIAGSISFRVLLSGWAALAGSDAQLVTDDVSQGHNVRARLQAGMQLSVRQGETGMRSYLAVPGGWAFTPVLGTAADAEASRGTVLDSGSERSFSRKIRLDHQPNTVGRTDLSYLLAGAADVKVVEEFEVSHLISRVGMRLTGPTKALPELAWSEPAFPGTIQAPDDGQILIHGPDGPTIGGYGRLGCIIQADLPALGQLSPGDRIRLRRVEYDEARRISLQRRQELQRLLRDVRLAASS